MDKESKLSPAVQPFIPKFQRQERRESGEPPAASSPHLTLPNPYVSDLSSRGNQALLSPRQRPSTTDAVSVTRGRDTPSKNGYSHCDSRTRDTDTYLHKERSKWDPIKKTSKCNGDSHCKDSSMSKTSLDVRKRGLRGTRSVPNSAGRPKLPQTDQVTFEVKMADFPELAVSSSGKLAPPVQPKASWGPTTQSQSLQIQKPVSTNKTLPARKGPTVKPGPYQRAGDVDPISAPVPPGEQTLGPSQTNGSGSVATSWANIASQPPKKPPPNEKTITSTQKEETSAQQEDGSTEKKKKKKKKKKSKSEGVEAESEEPVAYQEPPKFEDEEEFPGLVVASAGTPRLPTGSNTSKLCNEEKTPKGGTKAQSSDQNKDRAPAGKPPALETTKKGQKAEKVSGKKSKVPVQLDIGNMLAILEKKQQTQTTKQDAKPVILSVGGALPVGFKQEWVQKKPPWQQDKIAHNPLDSTSPLVKKGKQREVPKPKKPTPLKKVILKEREERKQNRLLEERGLVPGKESKPASDPAVEEQCDANDEISIPTARLEDQPEDQETSQMEREGDGEKEGEKEECQEEHTTQALTCAPSRPKIHSRKFRDYCSQVLSKDVDECVTALLKELVRFQDRLYQKDPMKARMKRRLVMGLREVLKHLKLRKVKCVVISPNCERIQSKGGLDEALHTIIDTCREQGVPFVFALSRKALGRCVNKAVPVSLVGIFNYDGAQDFYHQMIELSSEARRAYEVMVDNLELTGQTEPDQEENPSTELEPGPDATQPEDPEEPEEPEYIKLWKKMLEKECNHKFLNFEEQLSSCLDSECTEQIDEDRKS
ncbi:selenocysteine insertion sequence-binding protein 2-like isoform 2-T2 [Polymixia lowei]